MLRFQARTTLHLPTYIDVSIPHESIQVLQKPAIIPAYSVCFPAHEQTTAKLTPDYKKEDFYNSSQLFQLVKLEANKILKRTDNILYYLDNTVLKQTDGK